jgi:hypothetical protein
MEADFSKIFYEKYFKRKDKKIEVTFKNGKKLRGVLVSFFHGDPDKEEPFIRCWHLVCEKHKLSLGVDAFGFRLGELINQEEISSIQFLSDHSVMKF